MNAGAQQRIDNWNYDEGQRSRWEFEYPAMALAEAAAKQKAFRESRVAFWTEQKALVMAEVRESGVEVTDSIAASLANYTNTLGHQGPRIVVREELQKKLYECHEKITKHQRAAAEYDGWEQVLRANDGAVLKLTHADWLYFFGRT